jgi:hypothetical protein
MNSSKKKYVQIITYVAMAALGSFFLATYVEAARISDFLLKQKTEIENDQKRLILASAIANTFAEHEVFVKSDPLLTFNVSTNEITMDVALYALGNIQADKIDYSLAIIVNDLTFNDQVTFQFNADDLVLSIQFNQSIQTRPNGLAQSNFEERLISLYRNEDQLAIFPITKIVDQYSNLMVNTMAFGLRNDNGFLTTIRPFTTEELSLIQFQTLQTSLPTLATYQNDNNLFFDLSLRLSYRQLDWYYVSHFSLYLGLVGIGAYGFFIRRKKVKNA